MIAQDLDRRAALDRTVSRRLQAHGVTEPELAALRLQAKLQLLATLDERHRLSIEGLMAAPRGRHF